MDLTILVGLPASGKTTWSQNLQQKQNVNVVDCDHIKSLEALFGVVDTLYYQKQNVCLDGLFLEQDVIENIIDYVISKHEIDKIQKATK